MKTLVEFSSFSKQKLVSSRISKNQNSKSYLTSNQTDTNSKSKEKGKSKEDNSLSNRIIRANIKFPNDNSVKKDGRVNEKKNEETMIHSKIFEISVDKIFSYMKTILSIDIYANIKKKFIEEFTKAMILFMSEKEGTFSNYNIQYSSSISKMIHSASKSMSLNIIQNKQKNSNLKLSYDFVAYKKKNQISQVVPPQKEIRKNPLQYSDNNKGNKTHHSNNLFSYSSNINNNSSEINKKHSLYTLTKNKMLNNKTQSNSKSPSSSRERLSSRKKLQNLKNKNKVGTTVKNNNNNKFLLNSHLLNKINKEFPKNDSKKTNFSSDKNKNTNSKAKPGSKSSLMSNQSNNNNNNINIKISHNRNTNLNLFYINNYINNTNNPQIINRTTTHSLKKENKVTNTSKKQSHKSPESVIKENLIKKSNMKKNKKESINNSIPPGGNGNIKIENQTVEVNNEKSNEQLKEIKSSLDDNLKVMFNFSYEGFLNKESESESKKSFDNDIMDTNNNKQNIIKSSNTNNTNENDNKTGTLSSEKSVQYCYKTKYPY